MKKRFLVTGRPTASSVTRRTSERTRCWCGGASCRSSWRPIGSGPPSRPPRRSGSSSGTTGCSTGITRKPRGGLLASIDLHLLLWSCWVEIWSAVWQRPRHFPYLRKFSTLRISTSQSPVLMQRNGFFERFREEVALRYTEASSCGSNPCRLEREWATELCTNLNFILGRSSCLYSSHALPRGLSVFPSLVLSILLKTP